MSFMGKLLRKDYIHNKLQNAEQKNKIEEENKYS